MESCSDGSSLSEAHCEGWEGLGKDGEEPAPYDPLIKAIGESGFEPPTSCSQGRRANQAALLPDDIDFYKGDLTNQIPKKSVNKYLTTFGEKWKYVYYTTSNTIYITSLYYYFLPISFSIFFRSSLRMTGRP
jgi:hypothetical protein